MNVRESMEELESGNGRWQATEMNETIPKRLTEEMDNYARDWFINYVVAFVSLTAEIAIHSWDMDICARGTNIRLNRCSASLHDYGHRISPWLHQCPQALQGSGAGICPYAQPTALEFDVSLTKGA